MKKEKKKLTDPKLQEHLKEPLKKATDNLLDKLGRDMFHQKGQ